MSTLLAKSRKNGTSSSSSNITQSENNDRRGSVTGSSGAASATSIIRRKFQTPRGSVPSPQLSPQPSPKPRTKLPTRNHQPRDVFIIFNFYEAIQPPPMFTSFKDGFLHFMKTATKHKQYVEGMLLRDVTGKGKFPFVSYNVFNIRSTSFQHDQTWIQAILEGHGNLQVHHQAGFTELFSGGKPTIGRTPKMQNNARNLTAYLITVFRAEGNFEKLDETWQKWSGAEFVKCHLPKDVRVGRVVLHKRAVLHGTLMYVLFCELCNGLVYINSILDLVERVNERSCGYASLYVIDELF